MQTHPLTTRDGEVPSVPDPGHEPESPTALLLVLILAVTLITMSAALVVVAL
jgi:hypothetical protein